MMIGLIELLIVLPYVGMITSRYTYYPIMLVLNHTIGATGGKLRKTNMLISRGHLLYRNTTSTWAELIWRICSLSCLLYTSDAADERSSVDLGGRRIIKKKKR